VPRVRLRCTGGQKAPFLPEKEKKGVARKIRRRRKDFSERKKKSIAGSPRTTITKEYMKGTEGGAPHLSGRRGDGKSGVESGGNKEAVGKGKRKECGTVGRVAEAQ